VRAPGTWIRRLARSSVLDDSALVGDGETLAALCSTALQDDAAVLRCHANSETVEPSFADGSSVDRFACPSCCVLFRPRSSLCTGISAPSARHDATSGGSVRGRNFNTSRREETVSTRRGARRVFLIARSMKKWRRSHLIAAVLPPSVLHSRVADGPGASRQASSSVCPPKISTTVEIVVEKPMGRCPFDESLPGFRRIHSHFLQIRRFFPLERPRAFF
jgi:hypothetical protein